VLGSIGMLAAISLRDTLSASPSGFLVPGRLQNGGEGLGM